LFDSIGFVKIKTFSKNFINGFLKIFGIEESSLILRIFLFSKLKGLLKILSKERISKCN